MNVDQLIIDDFVKASAEPEKEEPKKVEEKLLPDDIDYLSIKGLRLEARQKLDKIRLILSIVCFVASLRF